MERAAVLLPPDCRGADGGSGTAAVAIDLLPAGRDFVLTGGENE